MGHSENKILAFCGSSRRASINQRLLEHIAGRLREKGSEVNMLDMRDFDIPLLNEDLIEEKGFPKDAQRFYELLKSHRAFLIACPEYNRSVTPLLKNLIDWSSVPRSGDPPLVAFDGKTAGLCACSNGKLGGLRGLYHVSDILQSIGTNVLPKQVAVGGFPDAFTTEGKLADKMAARLMEAMCDLLLQAVR